jgi:uncharacterized protein DUF6677
MVTKSTAADRATAAAEPGAIALICVLAWAVPGGAHLWLGRRQKGIIFLIALTSMFVLGLMMHGQIFSFDFSEPLVALAALADFGLGLPWIVARVLGAGAGQVTATTWEYGNCFLMVAGLLNSLVMLDAFDIAMGRK